MKRIILGATVIIFTVVATLPVYAVTADACKRTCAANKACDPADEKTGNPIKKLGRGLCNCGTFPFELPMQMSKVHMTDGPFAGWTWGILKGMGMMAVRAVVGVYEVATFPFPLPACYKPILTDPEFMFEEQTW